MTSTDITATSTTDTEIDMTSTDTSTDTTTTLNAATIADLVTLGEITFYTSADVKIKNAVKKIFVAQRDAAIDALDLDAAKIAKGYLDVLDAARVTKAAAPVVEIDWTAKIAEQVQTLRDAAYRLTQPEYLGEFANKIDFEALEALLTDTVVEVDEAAVTALIEGATKIKSAPAKGRSLQDALDSLDVPAGTFLKVSEIMNLTGLVSSGAITSRLFPKTGVTTLTGWTASTDAKGVKGATKA